MKNRLISGVTIALGLVLSFGTFANAQVINLPGRDVNIAPTGASIDYGTGGSVDATRTNTGAQYNLKTNGATIQIDARAGLGATISNHNLDRDARISLIRLENGAESLIQSETDLSAYRNLVVEECPAIRTVSANGNTVEVAYRQPARFLGIIKSNLAGRIEVDEENNVKVKLPWYSFLFSKDTSDIEAEVQADLSVETPGVSVDIQRAARTISVVTRAVSVNVTPCGTTVVNQNANNPASQTNTNSDTSTNSNAQPQTQTNSNTQPATTPASQASSGLAAFVGTYTGTFTAYPGSDGSCVASGTTKFVVNANGSVAITTTGAGVTLTGSGTVQPNGNFSGSWSYAGQTSNYSGKFSGNTASGTYGNNFDCSGTWKVSK